MNPVPSLAPPVGSSAAVAAVLRTATRVLVVGHENPDGDAAGSMLALRLALQTRGKVVTCALPQPFPARYRFLTGSEAVLCGPPEEAAHDCAVALDCDGPERLAGLQEAFRAAAVTVSIDHHQAQNAFADVNWCDGAWAATGIMVREVIRDLEVPLTPDMAACLYIALIADTGVFRFENTDPEAFRAAAELVEAGAAPAELARRSSERMPPQKARLLGLALAGLQLHCGGAVVLAALGLDDFDRAGACAEDTDGVVDELKRVEGARVMALLREQSPGHWRISLRSLEPDVAAVCRKMGGGGHRLAAGCELDGPQVDVTARIIHEIAAVLEQCNPPPPAC